MTALDHSARPTRPRVALLIPPSRQDQVLAPSALARLREYADVVGGDLEASEIQVRLPSLLADVDACLTGWGTPPLTEAALDGATRLRLIAHSAGSVKRLLPANVVERDLVICHAAGVIADAVAEHTILVILLGLRQVHLMDRALKNGEEWRDAAPDIPRLLGARTVGLVGAGNVGRKVSRLLKAFGPRLLVYDPYLTAAAAAGLGVESVSLDTLFRDSEIVSIHAPTTPGTHHMVGQRELDLLRDGALFVNCARAWVVDQDALLVKLREGKVWAALDVFDQEPLPIDHPFRTLPNTFLTPHEAGHSIDTNRRQGSEIVDEIGRFFAGRELKYRISPEMYALMA